MTAFEARLFERNDRVYLVTPIAPFDPAESELEEFAFSKDLLGMAPNKNIGWLRGQYVEADNPNRNGQQWTADELAIKSLTPMFMPVTVMHDPRTAVGLIADTRLLTPEADKVPRARIDNTVGVWRHRFPEVWEEAITNYKQAQLMQSMECLPTHYDCAACGKTFPKLPGGAERANWCTHLRGEEAAKAARILRNVCFTGTGLIFGSRGATGALRTSHMEVFEDEVAEFHEKVHHDSKHRPRRKTNMADVEDARYTELLGFEAEVKTLRTKVGGLEETAAKVPELEDQVEKAEARATKAETERDDFKAKVEEADETARTAKLASDRLGELGKGFREKLGEFTGKRLEEQAGSLSDDEWDSRLKELEELTEVARTEGNAESGSEKDKGNGESGTFSREETASTKTGGGSSGSRTGGDPSPGQRKSVVHGLARRAMKSTNAS